MTKRRKVGIVLGAGIGFFVLVCAGTLGAVTYAYKDTYYPGIKVSGIDLSGKSRVEGKRLVAEKSGQYLAHSVKVVVPDIAHPLPDSANQYQELELTATAEQLGLQFAGTAAEEEAWKVGHVYKVSSWFNQTLPILFKGSNIPLSYKIDATAVRAFINTQVVPKIGTPTPATIVVKDGVISVDPSKPGLEVNQDELEKMLAKSLESATDNDVTYLHAPVVVTESTISRAVVQPIADRLDKLGNMKLSLTATDINIIPTRKQVLAWFVPVQDKDGKVSLGIQNEEINKYLATQKKLDQKKSLDAIVKKITPLADDDTPVSAMTLAVVAKPAATPGPDVFTAGKFPGKYVEVNLATQKMYLIIGADLQKSYTVSTGKWSTPTPVGVFNIHGKIKRAYSASYGLYMPYWQNFLGGEYGLHELPEWPNGYKEGANHLGTPVSHGCVRLGVGAAEEVYNWTEDGTPIYIH